MGTLKCSLWPYSKSGPFPFVEIRFSGSDERSSTCRTCPATAVISVHITSMSLREVQEIDPPVVLLPQFGVVGSGSILLSQELEEERCMCICE